MTYATLEGVLLPVTNPYGMAMSVLPNFFVYSQEQKRKLKYGKQRYPLEAAISEL